MANRFIVALQDPGGQIITRVEFGSATEAAHYMDFLECHNPGYKAVCSMEVSADSFQATAERLLKRIMEIAD